jgi:AraC-like DNA-binding protein
MATVQPLTYDNLREQARALMKDQLSDLDLSAASLAADLGISEKRLHRAFAAGTSSVGTELKSLRMERAKRVLVTQAYLVRHVARLVGYRSPAAFTAAFRQHTSLTPRQWRSAHGRSPRAGGTSGAFYKPAERAQARRQGRPVPQRPVTDPGSWAAFDADLREAARWSARREGEPAPTSQSIESMTASLDGWRQLQQARNRWRRAQRTKRSPNTTTGG